jgi:hypothetical protein
MMNALGNRGSASVVVNYAKKVPQEPEDACRPITKPGVRVKRTEKTSRCEVRSRIDQLH